MVSSTKGVFPQDLLPIKINFFVETDGPNTCKQIV